MADNYLDARSGGFELARSALPHHTAIGEKMSMIDLASVHCLLYIFIPVQINLHGLGMRQRQASAALLVIAVQIGTAVCTSMHARGSTAV